MEVYTIGFTHKSAEQFFETLKKNGVRRLLDIRLNNVSQLAGFAKRNDLAYFLKMISDIEYVHELLLAPTQEIIDDWRKGSRNWDRFEWRYNSLLTERKVEERVDRKLLEGPTVLLCSEETAEHCHRRLALEYLKQYWTDIEAVHL